MHFRCPPLTPLSPSISFISRPSSSHPLILSSFILSFLIPHLSSLIAISTQEPSVTVVVLSYVFQQPTRVSRGQAPCHCRRSRNRWSHACPSPGTRWRFLRCPGKDLVLQATGFCLSVSGQLTYLFRQLGIFEEFQSKSLVFEEIKAYDGDCKPTTKLDFRAAVPMSGSDCYIVARPILYDILYNKIPKERIHLNKRVLAIQNGDLSSRVDCADGSSYDGDIIVGADGANSPVRQGLFKWLKGNNKLPSSDDVPMPYNCICLVGQTGELDPEEFPEVGKPMSAFDGMASTTSAYTWATFTTKQNTICWMVAEHLNETWSKEHGSFSNSDWGPEAAGVMAQAVRGFPIVNGGKPGTTLGHLIDKTDKDLISKVILEEKVYSSWYGGRTVLLGDACHKLNPAGGAGALSAIHDALCLANWINVLPSVAIADLEAAFKEYHNERYPLVMTSYQSSRTLAKAAEKNFTGAIVRYITSNLPNWLWVLLLQKMNAYRPQASFLDLAEDTGTVHPSGQPSLTKTRILMEALLKKQQQSASVALPSSTTEVDPAAI